MQGCRDDGFLHFSFLHFHMKMKQGYRRNVVISEFSYILFGRIVFYCFQCIFAAVFSRNFHTLQDMAEEVYWIQI